MKLINTISNKIKDLELRNPPVVVTVNDFDEEAATEFIKQFKPKSR